MQELAENRTKKRVSISFGFVTIRRVARARRWGVLAVLAASAMLAMACTTLLPRQYEYDEEVNLSLDALRGMDLDTRTTARLDRAAVRKFYASDVASVTRLSVSRRNGRRFMHLRIAVSDINQLSKVAPFAWATYSMQRRADQYVYTQRVGASSGREVGDVGWRGNELVAFRMHLPARILYHNAPSKQVERGNILVWEQTLADRLKGTPVQIEARMESQSILYSAITLFGAMAVGVVVLFAGIIWWMVRKGRASQD
jgi:nitrate reductase NapE component/ribosome biogenesis protein Nip4